MSESSKPVAEELCVALAGNPNSGKTTVFNALTGLRHKVGNYPGVTVEKIEGFSKVDGHALRVVDLPGTYSLTAYSEDEIVARNYLLDDTPDVVVNVLDASNLERHLYLTTQLLELDVPVVLAINMMDIAESRGLKIDIERLSTLLGVPIVPIVGSKKKGIDELRQVIVATARDHEAARARLRRPNYGPEVNGHVQQLAGDIEADDGCAQRPRWYAVKLLEGDEQTAKRMRTQHPAIAETILAEAGRLRQHLAEVCGDKAEIILADRRYGYISGACTETIRETIEARHERSDQIDRIVTHPMLGLPIFAVAMYLVFQLTFWVGTPLVEGLDTLINNYFSPWLSSFWAEGSDSLLRSLLIDGIIGGVGGVFVFVPLIVLLFLGVAVLEDSGYMARAAFLMDRLMHHIGLHGKSFIPMLIGFGCSVPGILATRTLESRRDRMTTMLILPLMSCGARLPIYLMILPAFFPDHWAKIVWCMYLVGIVLAVLMAKLFRATLFRGETTPFVMELPPYRCPTAKGLLHHISQRTWMYVKKAGTIILAGSIVLWALTTFPQPPASDTATDGQQSARAPAETPHDAHQRKLEYSIAGRVGKAIEPALATMGFDWKIGTALIGATAGKEIFVSQLGIIYAVQDEGEESHKESLRSALRRDYSPLVALCICLFCLISMPCLATFAVVIRESNSWLWGGFLVFYLTALAWIISAGVYQVGSLFGY